MQDGLHWRVRSTRAWRLDRATNLRLELWYLQFKNSSGNTLSFRYGLNPTPRGPLNSVYYNLGPGAVSPVLSVWMPLKSKFWMQREILSTAPKRSPAQQPAPAQRPAFSPPPTPVPDPVAAALPPASSLIPLRGGVAGYELEITSPATGAIVTKLPVIEIKRADESQPARRNADVPLWIRLRRQSGDAWSTLTPGGWARIFPRDGRWRYDTTLLAARPGWHEVEIALGSITSIPRQRVRFLLQSESDFGLKESQIVFHSNRDGNDEIYLFDVADGSSRRLTNHPANDGGAVSSPTGLQIGFVSNRDGNFEIYSMDFNGSGQTRLTSDPADDFIGSWNPGGEKIAFYSNRDGDWEIYSMNADGSGLRRLTEYSGADIQPAWSPNGKQIAWASRKSGNYDIWLMDADGKNPRQLTYDASDDCEPAWSSNGKQLVFVSKRGGREEIYLMNADGSNQRRLLAAEKRDVRPTFAGENSKIVFASYREDGSHIYEINLDGTSLRRIGTGASSDIDPHSVNLFKRNLFKRNNLK